ncbi:YjbQ family protein, partial [Candidatus Woesearchaeota archaeon]|nr:YjbQ family protein [Candidatus Woesearchaeota archaeon]
MFFGTFDDVTRRVSYLELEKKSQFCAPCHQFSFWGTPIYESFKEWLERLAPAKHNYHHHQTGEDNADAHLKRTLMGHQVTMAITRGKLDLGIWEQIYYAEFDGQRKKRVLVKIVGDK